MTQLSEPRTIQLSAITDLDAVNGAAYPNWLRTRIGRAASRYAELSLPTRRHEEWRLTNIEPIASTNFRLPEPPESDLIERIAAQMERFDITGLAGMRVVFVNGFHVPTLSTDARSAGASRLNVMALSEAIEQHGDLLESHLAKYADAENDAFTALNTAMIGEGVFILVPKGITIDEPIHLLNITASNGEPVMTNPRNLIIIGDGAQATIIEDYIALGDDDVYFTNAVTEFIVGEKAHAEHYLLERESAKAYNISTLRIEQQAASDFASHSVLLGGAIVRNNVMPVLDGEHCQSLLNGLYLTSGKRHVDNHMRVVHAKPNCDSRQFYKGVLDDESTAVFSGRIVVAKDAQKTDAKQSNANLLLTDRCRANTHPQLEIYADDVKCTHGATIGQMNEDAIFYLRARGITESAARGMLIHAYCEEMLERVKVQPIVDLVEAELFRRLPEGRMVQASMQEA